MHRHVPVGKLLEMQNIYPHFKSTNYTPFRSSHKNPKTRNVCRSMKFMLLHVRDCPGTTSSYDICPFPWCRKVKHLMYHLVSCTDPKTCQLCSPTDITDNLKQLKGLNEFRGKKHQERAGALLEAARRANTKATTDNRSSLEIGLAQSSSIPAKALAGANRVVKRGSRTQGLKLGIQAPTSATLFSTRPPVPSPFSPPISSAQNVDNFVPVKQEDKGIKPVSGIPLDSNDTSAIPTASGNVSILNGPSGSETSSCVKSLINSQSIATEALTNQNHGPLTANPLAPPTAELPVPTTYQTTNTQQLPLLSVPVTNHKKAGVSQSRGPNNGKIPDSNLGEVKKPAFFNPMEQEITKPMKVKVEGQFCAGTTLPDATTTPLRSHPSGVLL